MSRSVAFQHQRNWDLRAAGNFIGGGSGAGLIVTAALAAAAGAPFRVALAIGLGCVLAGLSLVWLEIGRPWRALNVFFHPRASWMTREAIVALLLIPTGAVAVVEGGTATAAVAASLACGFLYCQAQMLRAARGIPAWCQDAIVPFILAAGLAEGSGLYLIAGTPDARWLALALFAGLVREVAWRAYRAGLARMPAAARSVALFDAPSAMLMQRAQPAGLALIALALVFVVVAPSAVVPGAVEVLAFAGGAVAALAGWGMKALLITRAAYTRSVAIPFLPTRGSRGAHARQISSS
ncbi:MAG TPA: phenylacetyl CoA [Acetobacteraceae bacterium]|jgi:phenylacetyl-CoA:acceptor oxidoreductase subunit 2|nr:phenylacetyl CoA [Acetobacteraceae bacterium]